MSASQAAPRATRRFPTASVLTWLLCILFLGPFLIYPVGKVLLGALIQDGGFTPSLLLLPFRDSGVRSAMLNSFYIGVASTIVASLLAVPLAYFTARLRFPGKNWINGFLLVPLLLPPLVGAVGLRQMLGREGLVNTALMQLNVVAQPIEWLQMKAPMVVLVSALHLYPLIYLNLSAAWSNIDPTLEEAAESQGANAWHLWRTVTLPLLLPGYLSGALIVFIFAFVDLGTPLVFDFKNVAAVKIFDARTSFNVIGYVIAFWLTLIAGAVFWFSRSFLDGGRIATLSRGTVASREVDARGWQLPFVYLFTIGVIIAALLPHIGVILA
ncbi:MAG TPA: ABC transporter permease subunit, partial [Abditibacteriaceae bacterium]